MCGLPVECRPRARLAFSRAQRSHCSSQRALLLRGFFAGPRTHASARGGAQLFADCHRVSGGAASFPRPLDCLLGADCIRPSQRRTQSPCQNAQQQAAPCRCLGLSAAEEARVKKQTPFTTHSPEGQPPKPLAAEACVSRRRTRPASQSLFSLKSHSVCLIVCLPAERHSAILQQLHFFESPEGLAQRQRPPRPARFSRVCNGTLSLLRLRLSLRGRNLTPPKAFRKGRRRRPALESHARSAGVVSAGERQAGFSAHYISFDEGLLCQSPRRRLEGR